MFTELLSVKPAQNIIGTNLLTKFHEDPKIIVASTEKCLAPGSHVFQPTGIIFKLIQDIIWMNLLTKFHEDWTLNVAFRTNLLTKFHEDWTINVASRPYKEKCPAPGGHVFKATKTIFKLIQGIIGTILQTKFHDDRKINVTSRVLTSGHAFLSLQTIFELNQRKLPCPPGGHVYSPIWTIFELI
ncbi:hypothetical protein DPMN_187690 [Dreissena polymorpha]|uniref:Uncharacterized protein n=1 Tax=Dreissena polymorpha TaxID=45954 RepID=A0A9D4DR34_DREPO|nr:hypothetical protein DPMN_187690 [Dreissena polymorpha]